MWTRTPRGQRGLVCRAFRLSSYLREAKSWTALSVSSRRPQSYSGSKEQPDNQPSDGRLTVSASSRGVNSSTGVRSRRKERNLCGVGSRRGRGGLGFVQDRLRVASRRIIGSEDVSELPS